MDKKECIRVFADKEQIKSCRAEVREAKGLIGKLSSVFSLAGSEVRLSIMYLLHQEKRLCVCDLSDILEMQIPAIAQHLRKMKDGGIIEKNRAGALVYYSLQPDSALLLKSFFDLISDKSLKRIKAA
ncbi:MAG: winged helix-turn-helix transcriptional regulator [Flavobacteriales bacterium]|nr:winged helix-turn-helix transcriptional regulator [Flavobacteriales bacterium]